MQVVWTVNTMKLIIEARYSYPKNTISFSKPFEVVEETDKYYYCQKIGKNYYKKHENDVRIVLEGCWDNTVIWKAIVVDEEFYKTNNLTYQLFLENEKQELYKRIKDFLKAQIDEIETREQ